MQDPVIEVRRLALNLLARREHSTAELSRKLLARGCEEPVVCTTLRELNAEGLLSDDRFAEQFVASRASRGKGPLKIQAELIGRGIDESSIEDALMSSEVDWRALACEVRVKRFGPGLPEEFKERAREGRFLQQRGFTSEQIRFALKHLSTHE